jgi:hypothetical protein
MIAVGNACDQTRLSALAYSGEEKPPALWENDLLAALFCQLSASESGLQRRENSFFDGTKLECY